MTTFEPWLTDRLDELLHGHVASDEIGGVAWLAERDGEVIAGTAGTLARAGTDPVRADTIFRIASMTKPLTAAAALVLVEECRLRLDDPVDDLLPELADRRVLVDPLGPLDGDTVPADRAITVRDVLTNQLGLGMDFTAPWPQPLIDEMGRLGLAPGAPDPSVNPDPDSWMRAVGSLPLLHQPGSQWLYNTGSDVLGVLVARAAGQPLDAFLRERFLEPLGIHSTGFSIAELDSHVGDEATAAGAVERLSTCYAVGDDGERFVYDEPAGKWMAAPAFASGAAGLLSTVDDYAAFARLLLAGGRLADGSRLLARTSSEAMTTDHLDVAGTGGHPGATIDPLGSMGWGFGVGVQLRRTGPARCVGSYGWDGGLGSSWVNDPAERLIGVVLTTDSFSGPDALPVALQDFWTTLYTGLAD